MSGCSSLMAGEDKIPAGVDESSKKLAVERLEFVFAIGQDKETRRGEIVFAGVLTSRDGAGVR